MKTRLIVFSLLLIIAIPLSVIANPLWENIGLENVPDTVTQLPVNGEIVSSKKVIDLLDTQSGLMQPATFSGVPEAIDSEIIALAKALGNDRSRMFAYVRNNIDYEHYHGVRKGAKLTFLEGSGNDMDQCLLLVELFKAAGLSNYHFYQRTEAIKIEHLLPWLNIVEDPYPGKTFQQAYGKSLIDAGYEPGTNDILAKQIEYAVRFLQARNSKAGNGNFEVQYIYSGESYYILIDRVYVLDLSTGSLLDPSYKLYERKAPLVDLQAAANYDRSAFLAGAGGVFDNNHVRNLNETYIKNELNAISTRLSAYISDELHAKDISVLVGRRKIVADEDPSIFPLPGNYIEGYDRVMLNDISEVHKSKVTFTIGGGSRTITTSDLAGRKITINSTGNSVQLRLDDDTIDYTWNNVIGSTFELKIEVSHSNGNPTSETKDYKKTLQNDPVGPVYAILYSFGSPSRLLQKRYEQLSRYLDEGKADDSREIRSELLNIMGLTWMQQTYLLGSFLCDQFGVDYVFHHRFGRMAQEEGFYIDVGLQTAGFLPIDGTVSNINNAMQIFSLFSSAMEHGVIEQMQPGYSAVSTVNILRSANQQNNHNIYQARSDNWENIYGSLASYGDKRVEFKSSIDNEGAKLLLPANASVQHGIWIGSGWIVYADRMSGMIIGGGYSGGYSTGYGSVTYPSISNSYRYNPVYNTIPSTIPSIKLYTPPSYRAPRLWGSDPVDMSTGAFTYAQTDMETGWGSEPMGLSFTRYYSSKDHAQERQDIGYGWTHNLYIRAAKRTATEETLGLSTLRHAVPLIASTLVVRDLYRKDASAKEWLTAVLAVAWFQDQMLDNAVSIVLGDNTFQFIKQPDGTFLPPAGSTMDLSIVQNGYVLKQRHGNTIYFGYSLKNIADPQIVYFIDDPDGKRMSFGYHPNDLIKHVVDAYNRVYTFGYDGTRISRITDSTDGRFVEFQYDSHGNLIRVTDPEGKYFYYDYEVTGDAAQTEAKDHRIVRLRDHDGGIITQNVYDDLGRVVEQYLHGDTEKTWKLSYTGLENYEEDPEGGITTYYYDERGRSIGKKDAEGNHSSWEYDAQDRIVRKTSAEGETLVNSYDSNQNLLRVDLPRGGGSVLYEYDSLNRLTALTDPAGNVTQYTYFASGFNAGKNRPQQIIDPEGITTFTYFEGGPARGNVHTITDANGLVIENNYDNYGHPVYTRAPGNFLTQYQYSARGDLALLIDPNGVRTTYAYNKRRQVTQEVSDQGGPNQAITEFAFDNTGNPLSETSPADNNNQRVTTRFEYTPTEKLKAAFLSNGVGEDKIIETEYDGRDLEISSTDAKGRITTINYFANSTLASTTQPMGRTASFQYDADERLIGQTSPGSPTPRSSGFEYLVSDTADGDQSTGYPKTVFTDADSLSVTSEYDRNENLRFYTNKNGGVFEMRYDGLGRLTQVITPSGKTHSTTYNHRGEVLQQTEPSGDTATFSYNATSGRLESATYAGGSTSTTINYTGYDNNGNLLSLSEGASTIQRTYDSQNRVSSYTDANGQQIQYRYYPSGKLAKLIYPGGSESGLGHVEYTYWPTGRLKEVIDRLSSVTTPRISTYYWDEAGYLTRIVRPNGTERQITYDGAGRPELVREVAANGSLIKLYKNNYFPSDQLQWTYQLPYAQAGGGNPNGSVIPSPVGSMTYNADNQLVLFEGQSVLHDLDGNMTLGPLPDGQMGVFSYNSRNSLLAAGGMSYTYDPEGERIAAAGNGDTISYVNEVNLGLSQVLQRTKNGDTTSYVWGVGLLYEVDENGDAVYYHYDNVGSTIALTNDASAVIERMEYAPYGSIVHRERETGFEGDLHDTPYLFTGFYGCQTDSNGLVYLRERYYNTLTRRFINPDPAREGWNWYAYAGGDPMGFVDPSGLGQMSTLDILQKGLAVLGMVPGVGEIFDVVNAGISVARGNYADAAIHLASAIPGIGNAVAGAKMAGGVASASFALVKTKNITSAANSGGRIASQGGVVRQFTQEADQVYYRVFSGNNSQGSWLTAVPPKSSAWGREALALPPGNNGDLIQKVLVPKGTMLERSRAIPVPEWGRFRGGAEQFELLNRIPSSSFGPGVPLR